jgi:hypothetical protein
MTKTSISDAVQLLSTEIRTDGEPVTAVSPVPTDLLSWRQWWMPQQTAADQAGQFCLTGSTCAEPGRVKPVRKCYQIKERSSLLISKERVSYTHTHTHTHTHQITAKQEETVRESFGVITRKEKKKTSFIKNNEKKAGESDRFSAGTMNACGQQTGVISTAQLANSKYMASLSPTTPNKLLEWEIQTLSSQQNTVVCT